VSEYSKSGVYFFIENKDSIAESFADCFGGLLSVVAQNITITIKAVGNNEIKVMNDLQIVEKVPNKEYVVNFGDIQSEESKDILCEIEIPMVEQRSDDYQLIEWKIEYFNVLNLQQKEESLFATIGREFTPAEDINPEVDMQVNRILTTKALKEAEIARQEGRNEESKTILLNTVTQLETQNNDNNTYTNQLLTDLKQGIDCLNTSEGTYYMQNVYDMHNKQRSNKSSNETYITKKKKQQKSNYK